MQKFLGLFLAFLLPTPLLAQKKLSAEEVRQDFVQVQSLLEKYYPGMYFYEYPKDFANRLDFLVPKDSVDLLSTYRRVSALISGVMDQHLSVVPPETNENPKYLPFILKRFDKHFYIQYNQSPDSTIARGSRILKIDSIDILEDYQRFSQLFGADNDNLYSKNYNLERRFSTYYHRWYGSKDSATITIDTSSKTIPFLTAKEALTWTTKRYGQVIRKNLDYKVLDSTLHIAHLDLLSFRGKKKLNEREFKMTLKSRFKQIEKDSIQSLILDMRGNGGGAIVNVKRLLQCVLQEPFQLYDSISVTKNGFKKVFKPYLGITTIAGRAYLNKKNEQGFYRTYYNKGQAHKPNKKHNYKGNLVVLMDGGSYSATTFTIALLKNKERGIFVGTPPGGADWGSFAGLDYTAKLKNSGLKVRIPLMSLIHNTEGKKREDFFVQPDYHIEQSYSDFLERKDTVLGFALKLLQNEGNP
ncbi:S41 family peptidase [Leadbetterella byssophila]|uniref:S41 family peptidase n=1 Tax=Leadbetterella byssophila TaxID=316068 RepID=UPI0039A0C41D